MTKDPVLISYELVEAMADLIREEYPEECFPKGFQELIDFLDKGEL
jgi:hypothetical protein